MGQSLPPMDQPASTLAGRLRLPQSPHPAYPRCRLPMGQAPTEAQRRIRNRAWAPRLAAGPTCPARLARWPASHCLAPSRAPAPQSATAPTLRAGFRQTPGLQRRRRTTRSGRGSLGPLPNRYGIKDGELRDANRVIALVCRCVLAVGKRLEEGQVFVRIGNDKTHGRTVVWLYFLRVS